MKNTIVICSVVGVIVALGGCGAGTSTPPPAAGTLQLAVANGNRIKIFEVPSGTLVQDISGYQEIFGLRYKPDGSRLAAAICQGNRVVEIDAATHAEVATVTAAASCPWDLQYSPDGGSLAVNRPFRPTPGAALTGHLTVVGAAPLDRDYGLPLLASAYRPGGGEIAVSTNQGVRILATSPGYPELHLVGTIGAFSLAYSGDGGRLFAGTANGLEVLNANDGYATVQSLGGAIVRKLALDTSGKWLALLRDNAVSVRRSTDLNEVGAITTTGTFRAAAFSQDGSLLAVAETQDKLRLFQAPAWTELNSITLSGRIDGLAFRPSTGQRLPVLFVHGHSRNVSEAWFDADPHSMAQVLAANPALPIDAFFLDLPVHGGGDPVVEARSIADDGLDILAMIEGGSDSAGHSRVGILNMHRYQALAKTGIVAYSQGSLDSRYYIKNLMGSRYGTAVTVSELVLLAAPTHGIGGSVTCGTAGEPDRARRQMCAGFRATPISQGLPCGSCGLLAPAAFNTNQSGDDTFLTNLNGHGLNDSCAAGSHPGEAPSSRPTLAGGVLYANFYAANNGDLFVGGDSQSLDCMGRRLARLLAPDAVNVEIDDVPNSVHAKFPHHWETICMTLKTLVDHQVPSSPGTACQGLVQP